MKILTVDIGTGTQDIFLFDSNLDMENGFKLVIPSPTMMIHRQIKEATRLRTPILLTGKLMGGGPSAWAARDHASAGIPTYATPEASKTLDDEPAKVEKMGIKIVSDDEALALSGAVQHIELRDFDFPLIAETFSRFGIPLTNLAAVCVAVFDHGDAPPGFSDRQFRFDYLDERIKAKNALSSFAFLSDDVPPIMTRLQAVADSAKDLDAPLIVMDTAPAAILGAGFDPVVSARPRKIIVNLGNFHCLAFRLGEGGGPGVFAGVEGVFEHHTGEIDRPKLEGYIRALADGSLTHQTIFDDMGHGALVYGDHPLELDTPDWQIAVTGPRRSLFQGVIQPSSFSLHPYFAVPFGDMMLSGNFGMLAAAADLLPELNEPIRKSLQGKTGIAPWELES
ncbi:MAG: pyruvate formate lyase-activating protein [Chloroflexi bacterium HGW-Chloroflexi-6]|nr:MAG: pyruvate formate lyase-activating protein [Chloroflexi bacterium HGW-Chloroflexi-6]